VAVIVGATASSVLTQLCFSPSREWEVVDTFSAGDDYAFLGVEWTTHRSCCHVLVGRRSTTYSIGPPVSRPLRLGEVDVCVTSVSDDPPHTQPHTQPTPDQPIPHDQDRLLLALHDMSTRVVREMSSLRQHMDRRLDGIESRLSNLEASVGAPSRPTPDITHLSSPP